MSLERVPTVLCVLRVAPVVSQTVPGTVDPVLSILCVPQGETKHKNQKTEKKEHQAEDKS